jgi:hypothetical protein
MNMKQALKILNPETQAAIVGCTPHQLNSRIVRAAEHMRETEQAMAEDSDLSAAKETVKEYAAPYRETLKSLKAETLYALHLRDAMGIPAAERLAEAGAVVARDE